MGEGRELATFHPTAVLSSASLVSPALPVNSRIFLFKYNETFSFSDIDLPFILFAFVLLHFFGGWGRRFYSLLCRRIRGLLALLGLNSLKDSSVGKALALAAAKVILKFITPENPDLSRSIKRFSLRNSV